MIVLLNYLLAMKLLLDQGLPLSAATLLRNEGRNTIHVAEIGLSAAEDTDIIQRAREEERVLIKLDADFHTLLAINEKNSPSVIRIRIERLRSQMLTELILRVISECDEELQQGAAVTVEPSRIRIRRLPLLLDA